ncbi:MAG: hypothetical protein ACRYF0_00690 [Janthinobacterium lividum]
MSNRWLAINWERLDTISNGSRPLASVPIEGSLRNFVNQHQGYRRILASRNESGQVDAVIIEVIHKGITLPNYQVDQVFRVLYNAYESKKVVSLDGFTGFAAFYTKQNYYITGRNYANGIPSSTAARIEFIPDVAPSSSTKGATTTLDVNIDCVRVITHAAAECTYECQETVMWSCSVSSGGGSTPTGTTPGTGTGTGSGGGIGSGGGGTGGGGSGVPLSPEQYDDGSGDGYGGYGSSSNPPMVVTTLSAQLQYNQLALVNPCPKLTEAWRSLITFIPPQSVIDRLNNLTANEKSKTLLIPPSYVTVPPETWQIQSIQNASGVAINLDYFPIKVDRLPAGFSTPEALLDYMRRNLNSNINTSLTSFAPHPDIIGENARWQSSNPLGSIIAITIPGNSGSVITSSYASNHWTFSTLHDPKYEDHPVSGTREFGFTPNPGGGYTFYVRGADRIDSKFVDVVTSATNPPIPFLASDATWESWQNKFAKFITDNGGLASVNPSDIVTNRPDWTEIVKAIRNNTSFKYVNCK